MRDKEVEQNAGTAGSHFAQVTTPVARRSVDKIDRLEEDEIEAKINYVHDSEFATNTFAPLRESGYRESRSGMDRMKKDLRYGQYLELPKGRRTIFAAQERRNKLAVIARTVAGIGIIVAIVTLLWFVLRRLF